MRRNTTKRAILVATGMMVLASAGAALAADGDPGDAAVTATVTSGSIGSRSITTAVASAMTSSLNSAELTGTLNVVATEAARTGTNPWSVTAVLDADLSDGATGTITRDQMTVSPVAVVQVAGGGSAAAGSSGTMDSAQTLFSVTGQDTSTVYTGTYTQATSGLTLAIPNGTTAGVYTGNISVTLVQ